MRITFSFERIALVLVFFSAFVLPPTLVISQHSLQNEQGIVGRWDLTVHGTRDASWLEITREHDKLTGRIIWRCCGVLPIDHARLADNQLSFTVHFFFGQVLLFKGGLVGSTLEGTTEGDGKNPLKWTGVRAPTLRPKPNPQWDEPIQLFNGHDLRGWNQRNQKSAPLWRFLRSLLGSCWRVTDGVMLNRPPCEGIITEKRFRDFKLHLEFKITEGNSGVLLRGRYEVQIQDDFGKEPDRHRMGSIYSFIAPTSNAAKPRREWQSFDITLLGRYVTVVLNGQNIIDDQEIPGITGGALDSHEGDPGPLMLQGDHGEVAFRNIVLTPVKK